jgi:hypothetical protein
MSVPIVLYGPTNLGEWYNYADTFQGYYWKLDDDDDKIAYGFVPLTGGTATEAGIKINNITGNPPEYEMGVVTLEQDGYGTIEPTNTLYGGSTWQTFDPAAIGTGWHWITLSSYVTVTAGDRFALVIKPGTVAPDSSNYVGLDYSDIYYRYPFGPEIFRYSSTSWYDDDNPGQAALKYSNGDFTGFPILDLASFTYQYPEEWGLEFNLPMKSKCAGAAIIHQEGAFGQGDTPYEVLLTDTNDNILASDSIEADDMLGGGYDSHATYHFWEGVDLQPGTSYRIVLKPTSVKYVMGIGFEMIEEQYKNCFPGGTDWKWIYRPAPTSGWQYFSKKYPWVSVILTNIGESSLESNSYGFIG